MENEQHFTVWFTEDLTGKRFFLLPEHAALLPGDQLITNLDEQEQRVKPEELQLFETTDEKAMQYLRKAYDASLEQTKQAFTQMNRLAIASGKADPSYYEHLAGEALGGNAEGQQPFTIGKEIMQDILSSVANPDATPDEQMAAFKKTFGRVPEVLKYFDEHNLALAAEDPDAWAKAMHDKLFGEQEAAKQQANSDRLKREVQESIARGLRSAGMEPILPDEPEPGDKPD